MRNWVICLLCAALAAVVAMPRAADAAVPTPNVLWWNFDEGTGDVALDASGNGRDGTINGAARKEGGVGGLGGSLEFFGDGQTVEDPDAGDYLNGLEAFTISIWIKSDLVGTDKGFLWFSQPSGGDDGGMRYDAATWKWSGGTNAIKVAVTGGNVLESSSGQQATEWQHVTMVWSSGNEIQLYVDGQLDTPTGVDPATEGTLTGVTTLLLGKGAKDEGDDQSWDGWIDDVRIYDYPLTAEQIGELAADKPMILRASEPKPADGAVGFSVPLLQWTAGDTALLHNVYVGTTPELTDADLVGPQYPATSFYYTQGLVPGQTYYWRVDGMEAGGTVYEGHVWSFTVTPATAWDPAPADGTPYQPLGLDLEWSAGMNATGHDVYLGTDPTAVADGTGDTFKGNQFTTTYTPEGLEQGQTYYWRVDETAAAGTVTTGPVWTFTTVPAIAIEDPNLLGWWKFDAGTGNVAVDWSGHDNHGEIRGDAEWVNGYANTALNFDGSDNFVFTGRDAGDLGIEGAHAKSVTAWVYTRAFNNGGIFDMGARSAGQDFSLRTLDSTNQWRTQHWGGDFDHDFTYQAQDAWVHMALVYDGTTSAVYANGVLISSNVAELATSAGNPFQIGVYGWQNDYFDGLIDDVRLYDKALTEEELGLVMRIDPLLAWNPSPMNGELTDVVKAGTLTWQAGDMAADHDVYLGTDRAAVAEANTADDVYQGQVGGTSFTPAESLAWDQQYYWRVDEVNSDGSVTKGLIWGFTTADYLIVETFESYGVDQDEGGNAVFLTWIDGFGDDSNGSLVGYIDPANGTFNETSDVHTGGQAMPFEYNNVTANFSEATREFDVAQDWTLEGLTDLTIWYKGAPVDFVETADGIRMSASGADIWGMSDEFRYAYRNLSGDGTVVVKVDSLANTNAWAKAGVMIRESLEPGSKHAYVVATPGNGVSFGWRQFTADTSDSATVGGIEVPVWVKLTRSGDTFTAQYSTDGAVWEDFTDADGVPVATEISMASTVTAGLALTSHNAGATTTAEFSEIDIDGAGSLQVAEVGVDHPGNSPADLYVIVEDTAGGSARFDSVDAVNVAEWTALTIPLSELTGVNLSRVGAMTLGVTDSGGAGMLLFDDIRVTKPAPVEEAVAE